MTKLGAALVLLIAASLAGAQSKISAGLITSMAQRLDIRLARFIPDDPAMPIGLTQGSYIPGYGAVFMGSVNLAPMAGISPFHPAISPQELSRTHKKKIDRLPRLKEFMTGSLVDLASSLDPVPNEEQIAFILTQFYFTGEDTNGLPQQIVMHAQKRALLESRHSGSVVGLKVEEY